MRTRSALWRTEQFARNRLTAPPLAVSLRQSPRRPASRALSSRRSWSPSSTISATAIPNRSPPTRWTCSPTPAAWRRWAKPPGASSKNSFRWRRWSKRPRFSTAPWRRRREGRRSDPASRSPCSRPRRSEPGAVSVRPRSRPLPRCDRGSCGNPDPDGEARRGVAARSHCLLAPPNVLADDCQMSDFVRHMSFARLAK